MSVFDKRKITIYEWELDLLVFFVLLAGLITGSYLTLSNIFPTIFAATSPWTQSNWNGGTSASVVTGAVTTYQSSSQLNTSIAGQVSLDEQPNWSTSLSDWGYRDSITVTNSGGIELTDHQLSIDIDTEDLINAGKVNADCSDIRITKSDGTVLPYWIETGKYACDTSETRIWVKIDTIPDTGITLNLYYGNTVATDAQDGDDVFDFFDDFNDGSIDGTKWSTGTIGSTSGTSFSESGGYLVGGNTNRFIQSTNTFTGNYIAETRVYEDVSAGNGFTSVGFWATTSNSWGILIHSGTTYMRNNSSWPNFGAFVADKWSRDYIRIIGANAYGERSSEDGSNYRNYSASNTGGIISEYIRLGARYDSGAYNQNFIAQWDWYFVRKAVTTEPIASLDDSEETHYVTSGELVSNTFNAEFPSDWGILTFNSSGSGILNVKVRTDSSSDMSGADAWASCNAISTSTDLSGTNCVEDTDQYIQYRIEFSSNGTVTSVFEDISIAFGPSDLVAPSTNASNIVMKSVASGDNVIENAWNNSIAPYFSWDAGADDPSGNGLRGYCLYLGIDENGDPETSKGILGSSPVSLTNTTCQFIVPSEEVNFATTAFRGSPWLTSTNDAYYLNIKAVDIAGNVYTGTSASFHYRFDNTPPSNPSGLSAPQGFIRDINSFTIAWSVSGATAAVDSHSGIAGYQYRIGNSGIWYGDSHSGEQDCTDILSGGLYVLDPTYDSLETGENTFYFRTYDTACNVSSANLTAILKYNADAPSSPESLSVSPDTNTINSFSFTWDEPSDFQGNASGLSYCYTVNTLPSASSCTFTTGNALSADAYATQPGENRFYLVAKDEAGNINYLDYSTVTFTANTPAPGIPRNVDVADISVKSTENWRLAVAWDEPENTGAGIDHYDVYRSTTQSSCTSSFTAFNKIGATAGLTYSDSQLDQVNYYYCVKACDSANNCSAVSGTSTGFPDGKFTEPAELIAGPTTSNITTRKATVTWTTDRTSDSRIAYGLVSGEYFDEEPSNSTQVTQHFINLNNLEPETTYFYVAKWTDEDGNIGISDEQLFTTDPAPTVQAVSVPTIGLTNAIVKFTTLNASSARIYYGPTTAFGGVEEIATSGVETTYTVVLDNLLDGTLYNFKINTFDTEGFEYDGTILNFQTLPRPVVRNVRLQQITGTAQPSVLVTWESNTEVSSIVTYYPEDNPAASQDSVNVLRTVGEHRAVISGLLPETTYNLVVKGQDRLGNEAISDIQRFTTSTDTRPPLISNMQVETTIINATADTQAAAQISISWDTDEPSTAQVEFGEGTGTTYSQTTQEDGSLTFNHLVVISGLTPSKVYHLRAISKDSAGNVGTSIDTVTITPKATDNALDLVIANLQQIFGFLVR